MPTVFPHARPSDFTQAHLDLVCNDRGENQVLAAQTFGLAECQRCGDEVAWVTWISFPINVIVIHRADHVAIYERCVDRICLEAGNKCSCLAIAAADRLVMLQ